MKLRPVNERIIKLGILAGRVAKDILDARGDQLLRESRRRGALKYLHSFRPAPADLLRLGNRGDGIEYGLRGSDGHARSGQSFEKTASRNRF